MFTPQFLLIFLFRESLKVFWQKLNLCLAIFHFLIRLKQKPLKFRNKFSKSSLITAESDESQYIEHETETTQRFVTRISWSRKVKKSSNCNPCSSKNPFKANGVLAFKFFFHSWLLYAPQFNFKHLQKLIKHSQKIYQSTEKVSQKNPFSALANIFHIPSQTFAMVS